jgi:tetratricopeptide (TPR) repeat protein
MKIRPSSKPLFIILVVLCFMCSSQSAIAQADSLVQAVIRSANADSTLRQCKKFVGYKGESISDSVKLECIEALTAYCAEHRLREWQVKFMLVKARTLQRLNQSSLSLEIALMTLENYKSFDLQKTSIESQINQTISRGFETIGAYNEAIRYRKKELNWFGQKKYAQRKLNAINNIGKLYLKTGAYDSALVYYKHSLAYVTAFEKTINLASAHNNIGLVFFEEREFDSAEHHFNLAINIFKQGHSLTDSVMTGVVGGNLAQCLPIKGNKNKIIELIAYNIAVTKHPRYETSLRNAYFDMANLYYETNELQTCKLFLDSAFAVNTQIPESFERDEETANMLEAYIEIYAKKGDFERQAYYWSKLAEINDKLYGRNEWAKNKELITQFQVENIENKLSLEKSLLEQANNNLKLLSYENQLNKWQLGIIGVVALILVIALIGYFLYHKKMILRQREISELNSKMLSLENRNKAERLNLAAISLKRKETFANEIVARLSAIKALPSKDLSELKVLISTELQIDQGLIKHEELVADIEESFFTSLAYQHPDLSKSEIQLCSLIYLNLSIKEIATIRNITPNSVKIAKNRLSKKLGLTPGSSLHQYLSGL